MPNFTLPVLLVIMLIWLFVADPFIGGSDNSLLQIAFHLHTFPICHGDVLEDML